jgi:hypothetical protein
MGRDRSQPLVVGSRQSACSWGRQDSGHGAVVRRRLGRGVRKQIRQVGSGRSDGELIEYFAEVRPRVEAVPGRAGAIAQQYGRSLQPAVTANVQQVSAIMRSSA